ncbi:MAG: hypothetical protein A2788_01070 [Candidatus Abawacabacteria bacterium RIFCSPHIGHO2_01_FULL_46_8]|uniref:Uncharacterized protein n=1 Tax=Candidatus Abawacabacteria bacterium RIFCSPHIGHO2_01_FULL_46_8 TaxID=1817815 RepID=A0A1F4XKU7_9BACT|nr:MAG: hypothetical protein A2788_01070 [Candidatus Abawacabacteria bacterium RIFCSPHIGHO2_01_FULL_46_8]
MPISDHPVVRLVAAVIVIVAVIWALGLTSEGGGYNFSETGGQIKQLFTPSMDPMPGSSETATGEAMPGGR